MVGFCVSLLPRLFLLPKQLTMAFFTVFGLSSGVSLVCFVILCGIHMLLIKEKNLFIYLFIYLLFIIYFILFYFILFILFYFILFYFIYFILFFTHHSFTGLFILQKNRRRGRRRKGGGGGLSHFLYPSCLSSLSLLFLCEWN